VSFKDADFEVIELVLGLQGEIRERGHRKWIKAEGPRQAAEIYMERLYADDSGWEAVTVEVDGRVFDCQVDKTISFSTYERKKPQ
jgi:hypothetical protein